MRDTEVLIESQEAMETEVIEEIVEMEPGEGAEEIEIIEIKIESEEEEVLSDVEVTTSFPFPPTIPHTITTEPNNKTPISGETIPGQQVLFLHGTGTGKTIKFIAAGGQDPSDPSRPLTFEPAIKTVTAQQGGDISGLQSGKLVIMEEVETQKTERLLRSQGQMFPETGKVMLQPQSIIREIATDATTMTALSVSSRVTRQRELELDNLLALKKRNNRINKVTCNECGRQFSKRINLIKHLKKVHPGRLGELIPPKRRKSLNNRINMVRCTECGEFFANRSNLTKHVGKFHPDKLSELGQKKRNRINKVTCNDCGKFFSKHSNLTRHVKKVHPDKIKELTKQKEYKYLCDKCGKNFSDVENLQSHSRTHYAESSDTKGAVRKRQKFKCPLCRNDENYEKSEILHHFEIVHDAELSPKNLKFSSENGFYSWKSQLEKGTNCYFISEHGSKSTKDYKRNRFICHRSGMRNLDAQGANFCPAEIVLKVFHNGECDVDFVNLHIGHDEDPASDGVVTKRRNLKCPICRDDENFEKSEILHHFETYHDTKLSPKSLKFSCNDEFYSWKSQTEKETHCYFISEHGSKSAKDYERKKFVCHRSGMKNLKKQGTEKVYGFCPAEIVLKTFRNGECEIDFVNVHIGHDEDPASDGAVKKRRNLKCPICRDNESFEKSEIRHHFERFHDTKLSPVDLKFASEDEFYSWKSRTEKETHCCFISEHGSKSTKDYERRKFICHRSGTYSPKGSGLRNLKAQGTNKISGFCPAEIVLKTFHDGECEVEFVNVHIGHDQDLERLTLSKSERESIAAKIAAKIPFKNILDEVREESTLENKFERMHLLKKKDLHNIKQCFNLDREAVRDKLFDRSVVMNKAKICTKLQGLRSRHKASEKLDDECVNKMESGFEVLSASKSEVYFVQERQPTCDCKLFCTRCQICVHRYSCSCLDSCIRLNMCKHIHLVCGFLKKLNTHTKQIGDVSLQVESDDEELIIVQNESNSEQEEVFVELVSGEEENKAGDVDGGKEKLELNLLKVIGGIKSAEELNAINELIVPIESTLAVMREKGNRASSNKVPIKRPNNKKIIIERTV